MLRCHGAHRIDYYTSAKEVFESAKTEYRWWVSPSDYWSETMPTNTRTKTFASRVPVSKAQQGEPFAAVIKDVSSQLHSSFFGKLPTELRHMIYELALSGQTIKLELVDATSRPKPDHHHSTVKNFFSKLQLRRTHTRTLKSSRSNRPLQIKCSSGRMLLGFPLSCRLA